MKTLPALAFVCMSVLLLLVLGAATLFAEPEEEPGPTLGLSTKIEIGADQAEALVQGVAEKPPWQVRIDATFLRIDAERADEILGAHRPEKLGSARVIPEKLARQLVGRARGHGAIRPEPLPPLVLYAGQTGRVSVTGRHTYLQDYDVEVGMNRFAYVPIMGRIEDGTRLDVTPRREGKRLVLALGAVWAEVVRPIPPFEASLPYKEEQVTIELPEVRLVHLKKEVRLPADGGAGLAGRGFAWDRETLRLVVLQVRKAAR